MISLSPLRIAAEASSRFLRDHGFSHAAAVAYFSLLSLPPFLYLAATVLETALPERGSGEASLATLEGFLPAVAVPVFRTLVERLPEGGGLFWIAVPALVWAATTAESRIVLPESVAKSLSAGESYGWQVKAYSAQGTMLSSSGRTEFTNAR